MIRLWNRLQFYQKWKETDTLNYNYTYEIYLFFWWTMMMTTMIMIDDEKIVPEVEQKNSCVYHFVFNISINIGSNSK